MTDFYQEEFTYHPILLPEQQKAKRRISFSALLHRPSLMARKITLKKPQLKVIIPQQLRRMNSTLSQSTTDDEEELKTPTHDLETIVTSASASHLMNLSHQEGYSNFYIKLPNGNWMVRVRDSHRKIIGTFEIDGSMI
ncbi:hypothetical protein EDC96DRAFT_495918 [Choanephora cucurbitarum]|nr:hypothetical protein EDC96DRAFT_495918 [Choanephora cucurbitarum]